MIDDPGRMWGRAALHRWNIAEKLVATVWSHSSSVTSSIASWVAWKAALLTRTSTVPSSSTAVRTMSRHCWGEDTSPGTSTARRPASATQRAISLASSCSSR